jgi:hypothetical protein
VIPNCDITIFNKYISARVEVWRRSIIRNVGWQATKAVSGTKAGYLASNVATVFIPFAGNTDKYAPPKYWQYDLDGWTLQEGDVIVRGEVPEDITSTFSITDLRAKYDDVVTITSVDSMDFGSLNVRHWEVGCK